MTCRLSRLHRGQGMPAPKGQASDRLLSPFKVGRRDPRTPSQYRRTGRTPLHLLERLRPPRRDKAPAHSLEPALAVLVEYRVDGGRGADVEACACVHRWLAERQPIQRNDLFPGELVGGAPAHGANIEAVCRTHTCRVADLLCPSGTFADADCLKRLPLSPVFRAAPNCAVPDWVSDSRSAPVTAGAGRAISGLDGPGWPKVAACECA